MPTKTTKTVVKKESSSKASASKSVKTTKKEATKKPVVKRRKLDLTPTRASAVAIASQAAKKQALIDKLASEKNVPVDNKKSSSSMIPWWVWVFFWCSLLLFCISFYQAIIRPQLEEELTEANSDNGVYWVDPNNSASLWWAWGNVTENGGESDAQIDNFVPTVPETAIETIEEYFKRLSAKEFDMAFDLFSPTLQRLSEIKEHFTSFRMNPFISWIEWELHPTNFKYVNTTAYWKDRYSFDLSYVLSSNQAKYDETWEFVVDTSWDEPKIASMVCTTSRCSYHPIFRPENFDMMR